MNFEDRVTIDAAKVRMTTDGYLVADVRCARTGCQTYLASELGMNDNQPVNVYRPEEVVFSKDSMTTFVGKPVTVGHPLEPVTADNWKKYAVGDIGNEVARDGEFVRVSIKLMDAAAIKAVQDGTREISMGYTTPVELRDGVAPDGTPYRAVQTGPIRINHLALVPSARGGASLRIGDHWGATPVTQKIEVRKMNTRTIIVDGLSVETTDAGAQAIEKLQKIIADGKADAQKAADAHKAALDAKDAEIAQRDAEVDKLKKSILSDADLDKRVADRAALVARAKAIHPELDVSGLSDAAIRRKVVAAKLTDAAVADKSDAYIEARFDVLADQVQTPDPIRDAFRTPAGVGAPVTANDLGAIYAKRDEGLSTAWMGTQPDKK